MRKSKKNFIEILKKIIAIINDRYIEHFKYTINEIIYKVESRNESIINAVKIIKYFEKIVLFIVEEMLLLI